MSEPILDKVFRDEKVFLDGNAYRGCKFIGCALVYNGGKPPTMVDCLFDNVKWEFDGAAGRTIQFMSALYHGMDQGGVNLIERTFENIRKKPGK